MGRGLPLPTLLLLVPFGGRPLLLSQVCKNPGPPLNVHVAHVFSCSVQPRGGMHSLLAVHDATPRNIWINPRNMTFSLLGNCRQVPAVQPVFPGPRGPQVAPGDPHRCHALFLWPLSEVLPAAHRLAQTHPDAHLRPAPRRPRRYTAARGTGDYDAAATGSGAGSDLSGGSDDFIDMRERPDREWKYIDWIFLCG